MSLICCLREADESQIEKLLSAPESIFSFLDESEKKTELDKAWHGIHFLLTGSVWDGGEPLCYLITGGEEIGDVDLGFGPVRILRPKRVTDWSAALSAVSAEELSRRFNPHMMSSANIYPDIWKRQPEFDEDDPLDYLLEYYRVLTSFVHQAKEQGKGIIIYIA
jgi:hypothetical protein